VKNVDALSCNVRANYNCQNQDSQDYRIYRIKDWFVAVMNTHPANPQILKILIQTIEDCCRIYVHNNHRWWNNIL